MENQLYCGAAKRKITPPEEMFDQLTGMVNAPIGGVLDDLYLRVIALGNGKEKALFISFDLGDCIDPNINLPIISERTGIPVENILYFVIHTHTAPGERRSGFGSAKRGKRGGPRPLPTGDGPLSCYIRERLLEAVDEALEKMQPAKMGYGYGKSYINVNRNQSYYSYGEDGSVHFEHALGYNAEKGADPTLFVARFEDMSGKPIAFFMNYAVHCVVMIWNNMGDGKMGISGDIAGNVSQYMEDRFDGAVAMWSSGAAGDVNPIMMNQSYYPDPKTGYSMLYPIPSVETPLMMLKLLSTRHYADILGVNAGIETTCSSVEFGFAQEIAETPRCIVEKDASGKPVFTEDTESDTYKVPLKLVRVGDLAFIGVTGEAYGERGRTIRESSPMQNTIAINHQGRLDNIGGGYVLDDETYYLCMSANKAKMDDLTLMVDNFVPGVEGFSAMPGKLDEALEKATRAMFERI